MNVEFFTQRKGPWSGDIMCNTHIEVHFYMRRKYSIWVILRYPHFFCGYGTHSIGTTKCDISTIICDVSVEELNLMIMENIKE